MEDVMDDNNLLEDTSGKIYQKEGTGNSESLSKDAIDDVNKEKDTYSNRQAAIHRKDFNGEHLETVNDETHLKPLGQNITDTVNDETHLKPLGQNVTDTVNDETHLKPLGQNVTDTVNDETHLKPLGQNVTDTVNDETHLKPLGQNVTDTVNDKTHLKPLGQNVTDTVNDETHLKPLGQNVTDTVNDETHLKPLGQNVTDTVNDETHLKLLGQNVTDTENQQDENVFIYSINDESESVILKENENQQQRTGEIYEATDIETVSNDDVNHKNKKYKKYKMSKNIKANSGDSNVFDPTTDLSKLEDSSMMQRPPTHITVVRWAKENTPTSTRKVKPLALDATQVR
ncbi:uncharacterized protein [Mytilus edulis]|uniref:uncharacterized protein n=1 Tax=Mytilus edulis TaxID=6550 RepID=UPI0039EF3D90